MVHETKSRTMMASACWLYGGFLIELFMSDARVLMIQSDKIPNDKVREKCRYISRIAYKYEDICGCLYIGNMLGVFASLVDIS